MEGLITQWPLLVGLTAAGLFAGTAAGLFGIGGGAVIVPVLYYLLTVLGYDETAIHVAVATSLATIIATSIRSVMAHNARGAVDWIIIRTWSPWIMVGATLGMVLAGYISPGGLTALFAVIAFLMAAQFIFGRPGWSLTDVMPEGALRAGLGTVMGALSALMGIGGGTFGVTLMTVCGITIHRAIGTAAGFGVAIGLPSALAAIPVGWQTPDLPPGSLGYVNLPAFAIIAIMTVSMAPVGAHLAHALDGARLKRLFGLLLAIVAANMLRGVLTGG